MLGKILCGLCFGMTSIVWFQCYKLRKIEVKKIDCITYFYHEIPGYIPQLRSMFNNQNYSSIKDFPIYKEGKCKILGIYYDKIDLKSDKSKYKFTFGYDVYKYLPLNRKLQVWDDLKKVEIPAFEAITLKCNDFGSPCEIDMATMFLNFYYKMTYSISLKPPIPQTWLSRANFRPGTSVYRLKRTGN